ncbi:MAG: DUF58 domain-containing protein [Cyclobacteriaceae bacterium]|nr:DUF58 domain-containing protein [Cyclobacteriaceae bacterium]
MNAEIKALLKPEVINTVSGLELVARVIVEGFMSGSNRSQSIGSGQEFSQYRSYEPGDDLRQLDWKMYARSERYFIKQAEIETNITVKFMIDASRSMAYEEGGLSKLHYANIITAALAFLSRKQRDTFGLFTVNNLHTTVIQPRFEQQQFLRFLNELIRVKSEGIWKKDGLEILLDHHGKEMIVFITDLYDVESDILKFISRLKTSRNEVLVFHLMGKHEMELDFGGSFTFEDLEQGGRIKIDTVTEQKKYSDRITHWIQTSRLWMLEKNISYHLIRMDEPVDVFLRKFLIARKNLLY